MKETSKKLPTRKPQLGATQILSPESAELLSQMQGRLETIGSASLVWREYLTDRERVALGDSVETAWHQRHGTLGMVSWVKKCSSAEALLWLLDEMGALSARRIRLLRRELGLPKTVARPTPPSDIPCWNKLRAELLFGGIVVRRFRSTKIAHRAVAILDAFEECGWCEHIENPLMSCDAHQMREAVYFLNKSLKQIRFVSDGTSKGIRWERR